MAEYKSIKDIADDNKVSVQAVYQRLNKVDKEYKELHTIKKDKKLLLDSELVIKLNFNSELNNESKSTDESNTDTEFKEKNTFNDDFKMTANEYIKELKSQIEKLEKDKENLTQSNQRLEVLLKNEQENVLRLTVKPTSEEQATDDIVDDAPGTTGTQPTRPNTFTDAPKKKSIIDRLFKR